MKKLFITLVACLAFAQSHAATSALTESLLEYEAITSALGTDPVFENIIPTSEFIIDIKRITHRINITGTVRYKIVTRTVTASESADDELEASSSHHHHHHKNKYHFYIAELNVAPNPGIGPNIVTVVSITPIR